MPDIVPFQFDDHDVRVHIDDEGSVWFEAQDVCAVLGIADVSKAIARLRVGEKRPSESRNALIINESGLYRLIFRSNKPEAARFQDWVFGEVLPQIRKTGSFTVKPAPPKIADPDLQILMQQIEQTKQLVFTAAIARQEAREADAKADLALRGQQWLTGYCRDRGLPVYSNKSFEGWDEHTYPVWAIADTLASWLTRQNSQGYL